MEQVFELIMVICFGVSWPISLYKSARARSARGKSLLFELFIFAGYACGIAGKLIAGSINYVFPFYVLNILMVTADIVLTARNQRLDRQREAATAAEPSRAA